MSSTQEDTPITEINEPMNYTFQELWNALSETKELIVTIPAEELEPLQNGLKEKKHTVTKALKKQGASVPAEVMEWFTSPSKVAGQIDVRISLRPRRGIQVLAIKVPDPNF